MKHFFPLWAFLLMIACGGEKEPLTQPTIEQNQAKVPLMRKIDRLIL